MGVRQLVAGASVAVGLGVGGAALASPSPVAAHEPRTNGCTLSPDSGYAPVYYNFHEACDEHDLCYGGHLRGDGSAGRRACDNEFRTDMRRWCAERYDGWWERPLRSNCYGVAEVYYQAVRAFGGPFF